MLYLLYDLRHLWSPLNVFRYISVRAGARVERGQPIGSIGTPPTGSAGLYFELRVDGQPVDPLQWLRKR